MTKYEPPFINSNKIINLVAEISELVGKISVIEKKNIHLRRENRIRTIHSSLAIENNLLSLEKITDIIDGKRVLGNPNEIKEVKNAYDAYEIMLNLNPLSVEDLLKAHGVMTGGLIVEAGIFRTSGVGVFSGNEVIHVAPPSDLVPSLVMELINWYRESDLHILIKSCIFHYEFEFIHPFEDGNGRMGRLWHSIMLGKWNSIFYWLPVEELILSRQEEYYEAIAIGNRTGYSQDFVLLMLEIIYDTLKEMELTDQDSDQVSDQDEVDLSDEINKLISVMNNKTLSALEIMEKLGLSHRATFRKNYLNPALELGLIERTIPDKPNSKNQKYRKR